MIKEKVIVIKDRQNDLLSMQLELVKKKTIEKTFEMKIQNYLSQRKEDLNQHFVKAHHVPGKIILKFLDTSK